jgi:hypothetical protein
MRDLRLISSSDAYLHSQAVSVRLHYTGDVLQMSGKHQTAQGTLDAHLSDHDAISPRVSLVAGSMQLTTLTRHTKKRVAFSWGVCMQRCVVGMTL